MDDVCLCLLLQAVCLRFLQSPFQATQCLKEIILSYPLSSCHEA